MDTPLCFSATFTVGGNFLFAFLDGIALPGKVYSYFKSCCLLRREIKKGIVMLFPMKVYPFILIPLHSEWPKLCSECNRVNDSHDTQDLLPLKPTSGSQNIVLAAVDHHFLVKNS